MLDIKKIRRERTKRFKDAELIETWFSRRFADEYVDSVENPIETEHRHFAWQATISQFSSCARNPYFFDAAKAENPALFRKALGLINSTFLYGDYMEKALEKAKPGQNLGGGSYAGTNLLYLHASGYSDLAVELADSWMVTPELGKRHFLNNIDRFDKDRDLWFGAIYSLSDPTKLAEIGVNPTAEDLGPFWFLLQTWDAEDPSEVRNALTAAHEFLVGAAMINHQKSAYYIVSSDILLWDWDVRAINERRKGLGLAPVEVETYIDDDLVGEAPVPFVRDNIFWPSHLRYCEELGIPPYEFRGPVIDVHLDPVTGILTV